MRLCLKMLTALTLFSAVTFASSSGTDSLWLFPYDPDGAIENAQARDTNPDTLIIYPKADTGLALDGEYMNVDYKFTHGSSGVKVLWNYGSAFTEIFDGLEFTFDTLVFYYKGLLSTHTVTVEIGSSGGCGDAIILDSLANLPSVNGWTKAAIAIPPLVKARTGIREIRFYIRNKVGVTSQTSAVGNFKLDNIVLRKAGSSKVLEGHFKGFSKNNKSIFTPATNGNVELSIYSLNGSMLFSKVVPVVAGQQYNIRNFAINHSSLSAQQVGLIKINGNGVKVVDKIR